MKKQAPEGHYFRIRYFLEHGHVVEACCYSYTRRSGAEGGGYGPTVLSADLDQRLYRRLAIPYLCNLILRGESTAQTVELLPLPEAPDSHRRDGEQA